MYGITYQLIVYMLVVSIKYHGNMIKTVFWCADAPH